MEALHAGTKAPDFSLHATPDQMLNLSDFRGRRRIDGWRKIAAMLSQHTAVAA